VIARNR